MNSSPADRRAKNSFGIPADAEPQIVPRPGAVVAEGDAQVRDPGRLPARALYDPVGAIPRAHRVRLLLFGLGGSIA
ncbi:MAG: hypothetical protein MZU95_00920 [Desulfomicrobium escambiense]|nr:hypothetical protein [Desulfomicrobium escambiense]